MTVAKLVRANDLPAGCPPAHIKTHARPAINPKTVGAEQFEVYLVDIEADGAALPDAHPDNEHGFFLLSGRAEVIVEGVTFTMEPEDTLFVPKGATHEMKPLDGKPVRFLTFFAPARQL